MSSGSRVLIIPMMNGMLGRHLNVFCAISGMSAVAHPIISGKYGVTIE